MRSARIISDSLKVILYLLIFYLVSSLKVQFHRVVSFLSYFRVFFLFSFFSFHLSYLSLLPQLTQLTHLTQHFVQVKIFQQLSLQNYLGQAQVMIKLLIKNLPVRYLTNEQAKAFQSPIFLNHPIFSDQPN
jgi:hypothetical protein